MSSEALVKVERVGTAGRVALVILNAPARLNAMSRVLSRELGNRLREVRWRVEVGWAVR